MLRRELSPGPAVPRLRFRAPSLHVPLWLLAIGWLASRCAAALLWLALHPRTALALAGLVALRVLWLRWGAAPFGWAGAGVGVALGVWWARWPATFRRQVADRLRARWRWLWVYRRDWQPAMVTAGLSLTPGLGGALPTLRRVWTTDGVDTVRVRMLPGQTLDQWQAAAPKLAQTFGVRVLRARRVLNRPQLVDLTARQRVQVPTVTERLPAVPPPVPEPARSPFPRQPRGAR